METSDEFISILLADDDKDDRFFFQEAFKEIRVKTIIETTNDGEQLINYLTKPEIKYPHILFLDLNLPRKNGLECLQMIRANNDFKNIIIAIYSTSSSERDITESYSKGANIYIKKPNDYLSLIKIMEHVIKINWTEHIAGLTKQSFLFTI